MCPGKYISRKLTNGFWCRIFHNNVVTISIFLVSYSSYNTTKMTLSSWTTASWVSAGSVDIKSRFQKPLHTSKPVSKSRGLPVRQDKVTGKLLLLEPQIKSFIWNNLGAPNFMIMTLSSIIDPVTLSQVLSVTVNSLSSRWYNWYFHTILRLNNTKPTKSVTTPNPNVLFVFRTRNWWWEIGLQIFKNVSSEHPELPESN